MPRWLCRRRGAKRNYCLGLDCLGRCRVCFKDRNVLKSVGKCNDVIPEIEAILPIEEVNSQTLHGRGAVAAQGASFDEVVLANVFVLEVCAHSDLALKTSVANRAMVRQAFCVGGEVLGQVVFSEEPFLAYATFVRFDAGVSHLVAAHVGAVGELHVADIALEELPVWARVRVLRRRHIVVVGRALRHVRG